MSLQDIAVLGKLFAHFLGLFSDCFRRAAGRRLLAVYVRGLLSDVPWKNVEAIALEQRVVPRTPCRLRELNAMFVAYVIHEAQQDLARMVVCRIALVGVGPPPDLIP